MLTRVACLLYTTLICGCYGQSKKYVRSIRWQDSQVIVYSIKSTYIVVKLSWMVFFIVNCYYYKQKRMPYILSCIKVKNVCVYIL